MIESEVIGMKYNRILTCILAISLCLSSCSEKSTKTESTTTTPESSTKETTTEIPIGIEPEHVVVDGTQTIKALGQPYDEETIKERLSDPILIRDCNEIFGDDYRFSDYGYYMINLQTNRVEYGCLRFPIIKGDLIVGTVIIRGIPTTFSYDPSLLDPNYPSDPSGYSYIGTINEILKENPDEHFIWLYNDSAEFLLDSHNELHELKEYGLEDLTIQNQDTLYENYYVEECTIGADIFASS